MDIKTPDKPSDPFRIILLHGRKSLNKQMNDWGSIGPHINNVTWVHFTYFSTITVGFKDKESFEQAKKITGWEEWDEEILAVNIVEDLIHLPAEGVYYGDWEIQIYDDNE